MDAVVQNGIKTQWMKEMKDTHDDLI